MPEFRERRHKKSFMPRQNVSPGQQSDQSRWHPNRTKRHSLKHKIDRRLGVNLWAVCKITIKHSDPMRLASMVRDAKSHQISVFNLMAKQKLKGYYGNIGEKTVQKILSGGSVPAG